VSPNRPATAAKQLQHQKICSAQSKQQDQGTSSSFPLQQRPARGEEVGKILFVGLLIRVVSPFLF